MSSALRKIPFTEELLSAVADFECGSEPYEAEVADWIKNKGPGCVLDAMKKYGTHVWLYINEENDVVGFGSLGKTRWNWPDPTNPRVSVNLMPMVGIRSKYHGKPEGLSEERYSPRSCGTSSPKHVRALIRSQYSAYSCIPRTRKRSAFTGGLALAIFTREPRGMTPTCNTRA